MKYLKLFEEIKYTPEHIKLISQLRYKLNKFFGKNCCGVSKVRYTPKHTHSGVYGSTTYEPYTGSTMLFSIYVPSFIVSDSIINYEEKIKLFSKVAKDVGLKQEEFDDSHYHATEEQMKELIFKMKYIDVIDDINKYNL